MNLPNLRFEKAKQCLAFLEKSVCLEYRGYMTCDRYLRLLRDDGHHHGRGNQEGDHDFEKDIM